MICRHFNNNLDIQNASYEQLIQINGIGDVMADAYVKYFNNERNQNIVEDILNEIEFQAIGDVNVDSIFEDIAL